MLLFISSGCEERELENKDLHSSTYNLYTNTDDSTRLNTTIFNSNAKNKDIVFKKVRVSDEKTGELLSQNKTGDIDNYLYQRVARPYTHTDDNEPFIFEASHSVQMLSDGRIVEEEKIVRKENSSPSVIEEENGPPQLGPLVEEFLSGIDPNLISNTNDIYVEIKLKNSLKYDKPLNARLNASSVERAEVNQSRQQWESDHMLELTNLAEPVVLDLESMGAEIVEDVDSNGWIRVNVSNEILLNLAEDERLNSIVFMPSNGENNSCSSSCFNSHYPSNSKPSDEWYVGEAGRQTRLGFNQFKDAGYKGGINNPWNNYGSLVAGIAEAGRYEDENKFEFTSSGVTRMVKKYRCRYYCSGKVVLGRCWWGSWINSCNIQDMDDQEGALCASLPEEDRNNYGCHGTPVSSIILNKYQPNYVEQSDADLADTCYDNSSNYEHCDSFYSKTEGVASSAKGIYYWIRDGSARYKAFQYARTDKVDVLNMSFTADLANRCNPRAGGAYFDELENAFDDGIFVVNSTANFGSSDYKAGYRRDETQNDCLMNGMASRPKVFAVGAIFNLLYRYDNRIFNWDDENGNPQLINLWHLTNTNSTYNDTSADKAENYPLNGDDYQYMRMDPVGSQTGGIDLRMKNIYGVPVTYSRAMTGVDLLAPGSGWMTTGSDTTIGVANNRFDQSSGAAPHVSGAALIIKNWLLSTGQSWINDPGWLHTVMLAMGDRSYYDESNLKPTYRSSRGDKMYGFGRLKLRLLASSYGIPESGYWKKAFTWSSDSAFPTDGGLTRAFPLPTPSNTSLVKCVAMQIEDMNNKSSDDMVSDLSFKVSLANPVNGVCSETRPVSYNSRTDTSHDVKKMVRHWGKTETANKCVYVEFENRHITYQGVTENVFCYYSPIGDWASSSGHTCIKKSYGYYNQAYCWGNNDYGQLGIGTRNYKFSTTYVSGSTGVDLISTGGGHTCMSTVSGTTKSLKCWGKNYKGQLGTGDTTHRLSPTILSIFNGHTIIDLSLGREHSCALLNVMGTKELYCWGSNQYGQLGVPGMEYSSTPVFVGYDYTQISAGSYHTCGIKTNNKAYCWGLGASGQLGRNSTSNGSSPVRILSDYYGNTFDNVQSISAGGHHTCATRILSGTKRVYCWGDNLHGQLGINSRTTIKKPILLTYLSGNIEKISAGGYNSCAIKGTGSSSQLYCWGNNRYGQLFTGNTTGSLIPVQISGMGTNIQDVSVGNTNHTCVVKSNGTYQYLYCAGLNDNGQLGRGYTSLNEIGFGAPVSSSSYNINVHSGE